MSVVAAFAREREGFSSKFLGDDVLVSEFRIAKIDRRSGKRSDAKRTEDLVGEIGISACKVSTQNRKQLVSSATRHFNTDPTAPPGAVY